MLILRTQSSVSALLGSGWWETPLEPLSVCEGFGRSWDRSQRGGTSLSSQLKSVVEAKGLSGGRCGRYGRSRNHEEREEEG